jgi:hypothetical protein
VDRVCGQVSSTLCARFGCTLVRLFCNTRVSCNRTERVCTQPLASR